VRNIPVPIPLIFPCDGLLSVNCVATDSELLLGPVSVVMLWSVVLCVKALHLNGASVSLNKGALSLRQRTATPTTLGHRHS
jgi:hypothetical protein